MSSDGVYIRIEAHFYLIWLKLAYNIEQIKPDKNVKCECYQQVSKDKTDDVKHNEGNIQVVNVWKY